MLWAEHSGWEAIAHVIVQKADNVTKDGPCLFLAGAVIRLCGEQWTIDPGSVLRRYCGRSQVTAPKSAYFLVL